MLAGDITRRSDTDGMRIARDGIVARCADALVGGLPGLPGGHRSALCGGRLCREKAEEYREATHRDSTLVPIIVTSHDVGFNARTRRCRPVHGTNFRGALASFDLEVLCDRLKGTRLLRGR
jgi:hypothetical protein